MNIKVEKLEAKLGVIEIGKYVLPRHLYNCDTGTCLYLVMAPVEIPYRFSQIVKDVYCHLARKEHIHIE